MLYPDEVAASSYVSENTPSITS
jgi:predicted transcriptional regulator